MIKWDYYQENGIQYIEKCQNCDYCYLELKENEKFFVVEIYWKNIL